MTRRENNKHPHTPRPLHGVAFASLVAGAGGAALDHDVDMNDIKVWCGIMKRKSQDGVVEFFGIRQTTTTTYKPSR